MKIILSRTAEAKSYQSKDKTDVLVAYPEDNDTRINIAGTDVEFKLENDEWEYIASILSSIRYLVKNIIQSPMGSDQRVDLNRRLESVCKRNLQIADGIYIKIMELNIDGFNRRYT